MPAYIIVEVEIHDAAQYEEYKKLTPISLAAYDGRFIVRGGKAEALEGEWQPQRIVVLEFPTIEKPKSGGLLKNMHLPKICAGKRLIPE
jgi:uncharacterized protein (DUF1330 family)